MKCCDPSTMSATERIAELSEILAVGIQRYLAAECKRQNATQISRDRLDVLSDGEAACGPRVHGPQSRTA